MYIYSKHNAIGAPISTIPAGRCTRRLNFSLLNESIFNWYSIFFLWMLRNINCSRITISVVRLPITLLKFVEISEFLFFCQGISDTSYRLTNLPCCLWYYNWLFLRSCWWWYIIIFGLSYWGRRSRPISQLSWRILLEYWLMRLVGYLEILLISYRIILTWRVWVR
jgi:hypothetical protein